MCNNVRGHFAIITETESTYVVIEYTLWFDDIENIPGLFLLLWAVQRSHMRSREWSGRQPGNEARITPHFIPPINILVSNLSCKSMAI